MSSIKSEERELFCSTAVFDNFSGKVNTFYEKMSELSGKVIEFSEKVIEFSVELKDVCGNLNTLAAELIEF